MVARGELRGGERVREEELAKRLRVSRTPIRLALERLAAAGWLTARPARGFEVPVFSLATILAAIEVRAVLDGTAARLAAERRLSTKLVFRLNRCLDDVADAVASGDWRRQAECDRAFHAEIVELAKNDSLRRVILQTEIPGVASETIARMAADDCVLEERQHRLIVDAIQRHEGGRAEFLAREHTLLTRRIAEAFTSV